MADKKTDSNDGIAKAGGRFLKNLLRLVILGICVAVLVLVFMPASVDGKGSKIDEDGIRNVRRHLLDLNFAMEQKSEYSGELSEADINAYLYDVVHNRNVAKKGMKPESIVVDIEEGHIDVGVQSHLGFLPISYTMQFVPKNADGGGFTSEVSGAALGLLPLPGPLANLVRQKFETMFSGMPEEASLFEALDYLEPQLDKLSFRANAGDSEA